MLSTKELYLGFEKLFKEEYNLLANYALSILKNRQDAEDVVQDVFIKVWQNSPHMIQTSQVKFYLLTAVKNGCISFLRKQAGKTFVQPEDVHLHRAADDGVPVQVADPAVLVQQALGLLPPQCQVIFRLSRFGKLTYQQIAEELDLSVKTVENQMGKALRIMRDYARRNNISLAMVFLVLGFFEK